MKSFGLCHEIISPVILKKSQKGKGVERAKRGKGLMGLMGPLGLMGLMGDGPGLKGLEEL